VLQRVLMAQSDAAAQTLLKQATAAGTDGTVD
jgi:hypothetical protein